MKKLRDGIDLRVHTLGLAITILVLLLIQPLAFADDYTQVEGCWQCQIDGESIILDLNHDKNCFTTVRLIITSLPPEQSRSRRSTAW